MYIGNFECVVNDLAIAFVNSWKSTVVFFEFVFHGSYLHYGLLAARAEILKLVQGKESCPCLAGGYEGVRVSLSVVGLVTVDKQFY